jgi:GntR family transcriptional regulator, trigonelline degradation regulator
MTFDKSDAAIASRKKGSSGSPPPARNGFLVGREKTLTQKVSEELRRAIITGHLASGQRLIERSLCEMTGVSRTAVREALRGLESEGLVVNIPNHGPTVVSISAEEAKEIYQTRVILETEAVEMFMKNMTDQDLDQLAGFMAIMERACKGARFEEMNSVKGRFYQLIFERCGNRIIHRTLDQIHSQVAVLRNMTMARADRPPAALAEIKEMFEAVQAGDVKAAKRLCRRHVEKAAEVALEDLAKMQ